MIKIELRNCAKQCTL